MNKFIRILLLGVALLFILALTAYLYGIAGTTSQVDNKPQVVHAPVNAEPIVPTEVERIRIAKERFDNAAIKDLDLFVGQVFGKFVISKIVSDRRSSVHFSGSETITGTLQLSGFGGWEFTADPKDVYKLPQIYEGIFAEHVSVRALWVNGAPKFSRSEFNIQEGSSNARHIRARVSNLFMSIPPIEGLGSISLENIEFLP